MFVPTLRDVRQVMKKKGYKFFEKDVADYSDDYNLNIIGIRFDDSASNKFDDTLMFLYKVKNEMKLYACAATTDPGWYYMENPMNKEGCAIIAPGQYPKVWALGKHRGLYDALVQVGEFTIYRDNNKDHKLDKVKKQKITGAGLNLHCASQVGTSKQIDRWSAGCQVVASNTDYIFAMNIIKAARQKYGNMFTYTLLEKDDFELNDGIPII